MEKALVCLALLAAVPFSAGAVSSNGVSYTYLEGGYDRVDQRSSWLGPFDPSGGYVRGSYVLAGSVYVFGGYAERDDTWRMSIALSDGIPFQISTKMEQRATDAGLGFHVSMGEKVDFIGELSYFNIDRDMTFDVEGGEASYLSWRDLDGVHATVGLRGGYERFEGWLKLGYRDSNDFREHFLGVLGAQYRFTDTWGLVAEYEGSNEMRRYQVGLRASF